MNVNADFREEMDDVLHLNDQIDQLVSAKIPIRLSNSCEASTTHLEHLNANLALNMSRKIPVDETIATESPEYRATVKTYRNSERSISSLELLYQIGVQYQQHLRHWRYAICNLATIFILTYLTLLIWLPSYTNILRHIYDTSKLPYSPSLNLLIFLKTNYLGLFFISLALVSLFFLIPGIATRFNLGQWLISKDTDKARSGFAIAKSLSNEFQHKNHQESVTWDLDILAKGDQDLLTWATAYAKNHPSSIASAASFRLAAEVMNSKLASLEKSQRQRYPILGNVLPGAILVLSLGTILFMPLVELLINICLP